MSSKVFFFLILVLAPCISFSDIIHAESPPPHRGLHVGVCIFGLTRSLHYTISSIRTKILDVLIVNNVDFTIYLHTFNVTILNNPRSHEVNLTADPMLFKLLQPHVAVIDPPFNWTGNEELLSQLLQHGDSWGEGEPHSTLRNLYAQLVSLERVTQMWQSKHHIQAAIYVRSDVWFFNELSISDVFRAASTERPAVWTPRFGLYGGLNDRFALGNRLGMRAYGTRIRWVKKHIHNHHLHSESFLKDAMMYANVSTHHTNMVFTRVRNNGYVWEIPVYVNGTLKPDE
eukprot:EG_transcript_22693